MLGNLRTFLLAVPALLLTFLVALPVLAADFREGKDYKVLKQPVPVSSADKIEVDTVFWYGCQHCYDLINLQKPWSKTLGKDVMLKDIPVVFGKPWQAHAHLFYVLDDLGLLEKVNPAVFDAVQKQGKRLDTEKEMKEFLVSQFKVKPADFDQAYQSFGVRNQVQKASALTKGLQLTGVPAIVVDGRYLVDPVLADSLDRMLKISDFLIDKVRKDKAEKLKNAEPAVKKTEKASG